MVHPKAAGLVTLGKRTADRQPGPEPALGIGSVLRQNKRTLDFESRRWHLSQYLKRCSSVARLSKRGRGARKR